MNIKRKNFGVTWWISVAVFVCITAVAVAYIYDCSYLLSSLKIQLSKQAELSRCDNRYSFRKVLSFISKIPIEMTTGNFPADIGNAKFHIKQKHMDKVKEERDRAILNTILINPETYPLTIAKNNELIKGKFRLKGDLADHWEGKDRWSFRIRLKNSAQIENMREFSLQKPKSRQFPIDYVFQNFARRLGNITPEFDFLHTYVNGDDWGVMLMEEHIGKTLLEKQKRKASVLLRTNDQSGWAYNRINKRRGIKTSRYQATNYNLPVFDFYKEKNLSFSNSEMQYASYIVSRVRDVFYGEQRASSIFDIESFSKAYLATLVWHDHHTIHNSNSKYYFNPYTLRLEIVTTDAGLYRKWDRKHKRSPINPKTLNLNKYPIYARLMMENEFIEKGLLKNIHRLSGAYKGTEKQVAELNRKFPLESLDLKFENKIIFNNIKILKKNPRKIFNRLSRFLKSKHQNPVMKMTESDVSKDSFFPKHIEAEYYRSGKLVIYNLLTSSVTVERIVHEVPSNNSTELLSSSIEIPAGNDGITCKATEILLPELSVNSNSPLLIYTRIGENTLVKKVNLAFFDQVNNPLIDNIDEVAKVKKPEFVNVIGKEIVIGQGDWEVKSPLIVPKGYSLRVDAGTTLVFSQETYILSKGPLKVLGTKQNPVVFKSKGETETWKGIYVVEANSESTIEFADISGTTYFNVDMLNLTGGVNFYKSQIKMNNVRFLGSMAEDQLNIIHSSINLTNLEFANSRSDGFDSDFCSGVIKNITFSNIGGDALDTSGSELHIQNLSGNNIGDKVVSGGEGSRLTITGMNAKNSGVAVASKDGSKINLNGLKIENISVHPIMVYLKKTFYGPASLIVEEKSLNSEDIVVQQGNSCILNGKDIKGRKIDVKMMYKTGSMKK